MLGKESKIGRKNKVKKILGIATHDCLLVKKKEKKEKGGEVARTGAAYIKVEKFSSSAVHHTFARTRGRKKNFPMNGKAAG